MNQVPTQARLKVRRRLGGRCMRCGGRGVQWAHRRTSAVRDEHTNCPCNGLWLCLACHGWVDGTGRREAIRAGLALSRHTPVPGAVPVESVIGRIGLRCDGTVYTM